MQPLAYFAVRSLLGWLQFVEREHHAFVSNALLLVATGAAHCWAVVYALFIAIHTRAMRYDGYHEGYTEHLPFWVSWTETLSVASMGIWWAAGFTTAAIRIVDDDARGLPVESRDVDVNFLVKMIRSPKLHQGLAIAHTVSCVGLFVSIILLCVAMALMSGAITACELCLCFVSIGFALPHAVVACRKLNFADEKKTDHGFQAAAPAAEAAAQEAAALGPQLCVILALADSPGHAYLWQNFVYLVSAVAFVAAVAACGRSPPKVGDAALPPDFGEFITCLLLDMAASVSLVICFPHLNTWHLWALTGLLILLFAAVWMEGWRDLLIDLLDPLFVVRSDTDKALPGKQREQLKRGAWVTTTLCAAVALWDIMLHPVQEGLFEPPDDIDADLPDLWDLNSMLLLRWKAQLATQPTEEQLLKEASGALGVGTDRIQTQLFNEEHRTWLFKVSRDANNATALQPHARWKALVTSPPDGLLQTIVDSSFPGTLNVTLCLHAHATTELAKQKGSTDVAEGDKKDESAGSKPALVLPADFETIVGATTDSHEAYLAACNWWTDTLDSYYGEDESVEGVDGAEGGEKHDEEYDPQASEVD